MKFGKTWCSIFFAVVFALSAVLSGSGYAPVPLVEAKKTTEKNSGSSSQSSTKKSDTEEKTDSSTKKTETEEKTDSSAAKTETEKKTGSSKNKTETKEKASGIKTSMKTEVNAVTASYQKDQELQTLLDSGKYSEKKPYVEGNPYGTSPLTAIVLFTTKTACSVRMTVCGKKKQWDVSGTVTEMTKKHRVPVVGLYAGKKNKVRIELLNKKGTVIKKFYVKIKTKKLPKELKNAVRVKQHKAASAYGLTVVSGFDTAYPFAFDENGDIRWYMDGVYDTYGYFPLSNQHFILMDGETCTQTYVKPMSQSVNEMDYMGRVYQTYLVKNGVHHEVIEKTPGGNLLVLTNSLEEHCEDCIQEINRKTGKVVKTLNMKKIFGKKFMDMTDWAHLNTVSYNKKEHTVLISVRNCDAVVKLNWDTDEIVWILGDESLYKGTKLAKYLLNPKGDDFYYQYQQHSAYELSENLDDNKNTVEIMMFDNHFVSKREVSSFDGKESSFVTIYSVNEKKKTVEIWKSFEGVKSKVYSNYRLELKEGRVFYMGGCLEKAWKPGHRKGVIYEFDYATEKVLNIYSIKSTFYRAYELEVDLNVCAKALSKPKNPVLGEGYTFQKNVVKKTVPTEKVSSDKIYCYLKDNSLAVHSVNHQISTIELLGKKNSYSFQLAALSGGDEKFRKMELSTVVSLDGVEADTYQVILTVNGRRQNTGESITIS